MQSCRVSVMSVKSSIKTSDNSEGQRQNTVWFISWTRKNILRSSRCLSLYEFIFSSQKKFCKKGNCGDPVLHKHEGKVWHVAPEKWAQGLASIMFFFFCSMRVIFHSLFDASLRRAACMTWRWTGWLSTSDKWASSCASNIFSSMQEITLCPLYFLRQSRLRFMLIWHIRPIKSQVPTYIVVSSYRHCTTTYYIFESETFTLLFFYET